MRARWIFELETFYCTVVPLLVVALLASGVVSAQERAVVNPPDAKELELLINSVKSPAAKQVVQQHAAAVLAAGARQQHVAIVMKTLQGANGTFEKCNTTPEPLAAALGGPSPLFDSLRLVNMADTVLGIKAKREADPFQQDFYEHLAEIDTLEELVVMNTVAQDAWLAPLGKLKSLKSLRIVNQGKLTDQGLAKLSGLKQLEAFSFIGTQMTGESFKDFKGWTNLKRSSYRGSSMSEAGLIALCEAFPNLESLVLAHGKYTDTAVTKLANLKQLKGLEIGSTKATPDCLQSVVGLPLEYLQIGGEFPVTQTIKYIKEIKTIKKLSLTSCIGITDDDLRTLATMKHLENLELTNLDLPAERVPLLSDFGFLQILRTTQVRKPHDPDMQERLKKLLPKTNLVFQ